jgi:hypothetical protein
MARVSRGAILFACELAKLYTYPTALSTDRNALGRPLSQLQFCRGVEAESTTRSLGDGPKNGSRTGLFRFLVCTLKADIRRSGGIVG